MFIRSERLFLRPGWPEDWREIFSQIADEGVVRNLAQVPWPYTGEAARQFAELGQDPRRPHFLVTLPGADGARVIGYVGLAPAPEGVAKATIASFCIIFSILLSHKDNKTLALYFHIVGCVILFIA